MWGSEADAELAVARALLSSGQASRADAALDAASKLLRDSKEVRLQLRRDVTLALVRQALGRDEEVEPILDRALAEARRVGLTGVALEVRLAMLSADIATAGSLSTDARNAGFLLIARRSR